MAADETSSRGRILVLFMIIGLLPMSVGSLILINGARTAHLESSANGLSALADNAQTALSNYLQHRIVQVATIGIVPEVRTAVLRANTQPVTPQQEQVESDWDELDANESPLLRNILGNSVSRFLRDYIYIAPGFRELIVADVHGRVIAATNKTEDYFQADEKWWQNAYRQGVGGHFLSDITFDESANLYALELAEPIIDDQTNTAIGAVKAVFDAQEIFGLVNFVHVGEQGTSLLIRGDGTVVVGRTPGVAGTATFPHAAAVVEAMNNERRFIRVQEGERFLILGLAGAKLQETYPELDWYLLVREPEEATYGPLLNLNWQFLGIVLFSVLVVLASAAVFSWLLTRPVIESDPQLNKL